MEVVCGSESGTDGTTVRPGLDQRDREKREINKHATSALRAYEDTYGYEVNN
jgi:hypothetical protein